MFNFEDSVVLDLSNNIVPSAADLSGDPLSLDIAASNTNEPSYRAGTLSADNFEIDPSHRINIFSGEGNVDFGAGNYDNIDLSDISVNEVINYNPAQINDGGALINPGDGARVFDQLVLADGTEIYFEGIDRLTFADGIQDLCNNPDDPLFEEQFNLHMIGVHNAWRFTQGSDDVLIGVQDSGLAVFDGNNVHPDIRGEDTLYSHEDNIGDDFSIGNGASAEIKPGSHGTAVQGIIAARANNGEGIAGVNWNSEVYNVDVLYGNTGDLDLAEATEKTINAARDEGKKLVINLSLSVPDTFGNLEAINPEFANIIETNPDVLFVIAAGNSGDSQYGEGLTVMAPSEHLSINATHNGNFGYDGFDGTSAAAPNVTGVASLVLSANPNLTAPQVKQIIAETAMDIGTPGYDNLNGHGLINADAAVRRLELIHTNTSKGF